VGTVALAIAAVVVTSLWFNVRLTTARNESEQNRRLSETNRLAAEASATASRERLIRMQVVTGNRLVAEGDPLAGALWFAEALRGVAATATNNPRAELPHRRRLAAAWAAAPRLVGVLPAEHSPTWRTQPPFGSSPAEPTKRPFRLESTADGDVLVVRREGGYVTFLAPEPTELLPAARAALSVALNADGTLALVFARDRSQRVWNLATGRPLTPTLPGDDYGVEPRWTPDGRFWIRIREESRRWFIERRSVAVPEAEPVLAWVDSHLFSLQFDPGGRWLATSHWDGTVRLWDAATLKPVGEPLRHANGIEVIAFSPDGSRLATGGWGEEARVWSVPDGRLLTPPLRTGHKVAALSFSPDGRYLLTAVPKGFALIWDLFQPEPETLAGLASGTQLLAVTPQGVIAAWGQDRRAHFWVTEPGAATDGFRHRQTETNRGMATHLELSADGQMAAATFADGRALLWQVNAGELLHTFRAGPDVITHATFSPDGRWLATAAADGVIRRFEVATGRELTLALNHGGMPRRVAFSPDSRRLATGGTDRTVKVWDAETGGLLGTLPHTREVVRVAFHPAGTHLLSSLSDGSEDGLSAQLWDARTFQPVGRPMEHAHGVPEAKFFPDGSRILTASEESEARVWSAADGSPLTPWIRCGRRILRTEVSPDGFTAATVDESRTLRLWDADTGELLSASLPGETVFHAAFVGTDRVAYGSYEGPLRLQALPVIQGAVDELAALARATAGQELDATGGQAQLPESARLEHFDRLRGNNPGRFALHLSEPAWHRQEVRRAAAAGNAFAEEFHRRVLHAARPAAKGN
jgi:WD40 repeat protein